MFVLGTLPLTMIFLRVIFRPTALIALAASAADANNYYCPNRELKIAKYDDLPFVDPARYFSLSYTTFQVDQYDGWIPPTSGNQMAMAFGGSGNISIPNPYVFYPPSVCLVTHTFHSPSKQTFNLHSFSYACVSGIPQPECAISIWGWKLGGHNIMRVITFPKLDPGHVIEDFQNERDNVWSKLARPREFRFQYCKEGQWWGYVWWVGAG
jgi:hypothetical protein